MSELKVKIRPLDDHIVLEPVVEEISSSGLIIPDTVSKDKPQKGKVIAVGKGRFNDKGERIPMDVKVGDIVLFTKYGPTEVKVDGMDFLVVSQGDVLAVIE